MDELHFISGPIVAISSALWLSQATSSEGASACSQSSSTTTGSSDMKDMEKLIMSLMSGDTSVLTQQLEGLDLGTSSGTTSRCIWSNTHVKLPTSVTTWCTVLSVK